MKQTFWLLIAVVFLFGAAVVHGDDEGTLENINCAHAASISFSVRIPDIAQWGSGDQSSWRLNDIAGCEPTFSGAVVTYSDINVATCDTDGPTATADESKFEYEFIIDVSAEAGSGTDPVTFAYDHYYVVKCFYNREQENLMASFQPRHSLTDSGSGVADFVILFKVYDAADNEVTSIIDLRTPVYGKLSIDGADFPQGLDIHLREVTADNDDTAGGEFTLIRDGCAESSVVTATTCDTDYDDQFNFEVFRFPGQSTGNLVYLRATVIVCLTSNTGSICQTQCDACPAGRKRRATLEEIQQTEFYVTAGPFKIREPDQESEAAADKSEGKAFPTYMIAVAAVCGLLAVAIISAVVLIVFVRRSKNVENVELQNEDSVTA